MVRGRGAGGWAALWGKRNPPDGAGFFGRGGRLRAEEKAPVWTGAFGQNDTLMFCGKFSLPSLSCQYVAAVRSNLAFRLCEWPQ